jgi:cytochrome c oxidase cbb3-type subunit 3
MMTVIGAFALVAPLMAQAPAGAAGAAGASGGRGRGGRGGRGVVAPAAGGQRTSGFPQYTRQLAPQDVLARGKSLYDAQCASCHAADARGVLDKHGPNLLQSGEVFQDQHGERVAASLASHTPAINLPADDTYAISDYIHSIQATMGAQGSPPGRNPVGLTYNVLVGNVKDGEAAFGKLCSSCHSVTGDLKGIGAKYAGDPKTLQNSWVSGGGGGGRGGGGRGGGGGGQQATVTLANGQKIEGTLVRKDDFLVIITLPDGTRKSFVRENMIPKVEVKDPNEAHKKMMLAMDDPDNKNMHDITAYLATIK